MKNISVIGSGTMGNGIAHVFAQHGFEVNLIDVSTQILENAMHTLSANLDRQVRKGTINEIQKGQTIEKINTFTKVERGVDKADLIVEAVTENPGIKKELFGELHKYAPEACIIASNTSSISITSLAAATGRPLKVIGMHFMNPVPVMPLVEIIRGYSTSEETTAEVMAVSEKIGKIPVEVSDYPGFVSNRILMPMINEAISVLFQGIAGVKEIDSVMKLGMAHPMGPLQLADFIGLDVCLSILSILRDGFGDPKYAPCPLLVKMVESGHLGKKTGTGFYNWTAGSKDITVADSFKQK